MSKTITGTITVGVTLAVNPTIIDGTIAAGGPDAVYGSAAETWTVANNGYVDGYEGIGILIRGGAQISNAASASISAYDGDIVVDGAATIANAGKIESLLGAAIYMGGGGAVTNSAGGVIESNYAGIVAYKNGNFNLLNQGVISGYYGFGVAAAGTITNAKSGIIAGDVGVVLIGGTINNAGLIEDAHYYYYGPAIDLAGQKDDEIIEQKTGTLIGGIAGFLGGDTIDEAGITITSVAFANDTLTLYDGTARLGTLGLYGNFNTDEFILKSDGQGGTNIELGAETVTGTYAQGVLLSALRTTVAAHALINGLEAGYNRHFTLVNHGTIIATYDYADGVQFSSSGRITNTGEIEGEIGIYAFGGAITNSGLVKGNIGIVIAGGTITNSGTIDGSEGIAIDLRYDTATTDIILKSGSVLKGGIAGFETGDTIDLAGVTATGETFGNGVLTLTNAGKVVDTIALDGFFNTAAFKLAAAKGGGTDITIAPAETFTGHYGSELVLSSLLTSITSKASFANGLVASYGRDWTVVNAGTLSGPDNCVLLESGNFTNTGTGTIVGATGVYLSFSFDKPASLSNAGTIIGTAALQGVGVSVTGYGYVSNLKSGTISGAYAGVSMIGGTFENAGQISGPTGMIGYYGMLYNAGRIEGVAGGQHGAASADTTGIDIQGGHVTNAAQGIISGDIGVKLSNAATLTDAGTIASTLETGGTAIAFITGYYASTLVLDPGNVIEGAISGFGDGDIIDFAATTLTADTFSNHVLSLLDGTKTIEKLTLAGTYSQDQFELIPQGSLGTELILTSLAASPVMHFLRPAWPPTLAPEPFASAAPPGQAKAATPALSATLGGWLPLHQAHPAPLFAVTLQPG